MENEAVQSIIFDEKTRKIFAERIKLLRKEKKLSAEKLGKYLGYSQSSISSYECCSRKPDVDVLYAYAEFFNVPSDYLLGRIDSRIPLHSIACLSKITDEDVGIFSKELQDDISNFIEFRLHQEKLKKDKQS